MVRIMKTSKRALGLLLALCILTTILPVGLQTQVSAAPAELPGDIVVTSTADSGAGSLRAAVAAAVNGDVITFADSLFGAGGATKITVTIKLTSTIAIGNKQISIRGKISTEGEPQVILDGGNTSQVLYSTSSEGLSLYGLQIQNGKSASAGGGVYLSSSSNTLMAESCVFFNNAASSNGGGVYAGNLQVIDCVFDGNTSESSGGGAYVVNNLTTSDCVVKNNKAGLNGGGVRARKSELINTMFLNNITTGSGSDGGGIYSSNTTSSNTTARNCIFDANTSLSEGGGAHVSGGEFIGCTFKNNKSDAGGGLYSSDALSVVNSTFIQNEAESLGGAIRTANNLEIKSSSFYSNRVKNADSSGGACSSFVEMKVTDSIFVLNRAEFKGGALYSSKQMTVINSCFLSNRTYNYKGAAVYTASSLIAVNSTFQGNKAISNNRNCGGVYSTLSGYLYHCTLANDGNVSPVSDRSLFLYNSIITGTNEPWLKSVNGSISGGANIIRDSSGQPTYAEMFGTNPVTHNYLMPLPTAPNIKAAPVITDIQIPEGANKAEILALLKTDAAGAQRGTESCTFGAVEATAVAFEVTNRNPDGTGSLYAATITADGYTATPAPDKRIIHFNESADGEIVVDKRIHTGFPTVISGRVDSKGNKTISLAAPEESKLPVVTNEGTFNLTIYNLSLAGGGYSTVFGGRSLTMEGCTVSGGTKTGSGQFGQYGHGGGIYSEGTVTISNSVISESSASDSGGGIYAKGNVNLRYSKIINNTAAKAGGGVYAEGKVTAEDCVFEGNTSQNTGSEGGGALFSNGAFLEDCVFQNNRADYAGGAIHGKNNSTFTALNTVFNKNTSEEIGAIYLSRGTLNMVNCIMTENSATGSDFHYGGIYTSRGTIRLFQTTIADNSGYGVHVNLASGSLHLYNSIVAGNESPDVSPATRVFTGTSLVGGKDGVTREFVFGTNSTAPSGLLRIMSGGLGHSKADVLTAADLTATGITDETECNLILAALAKDAIGVARSESGKVSYGALETPADKYATFTVKTPPNKTTYSFNESVNYSTALDGGVLRYAFLGGGGGTVPMIDPLVTNNMEERLITSSAGNKSVTFSYLGKSVGQVFVVSKGTQEPFSIKEGNLVKSVGDPVFSLTAEGGTGTGTVSWSLSTGASTYVTLSNKGGGVCEITIKAATPAGSPITITATKAGGTNYEKTTAQITLTVNPPKPTYTVTIPAEMDFGTITKSETESIQTQPFTVSVSNASNLGNKAVTVRVSGDMQMSSGGHVIPFEVYTLETGGGALLSGDVFGWFGDNGTIPGTLRLDEQNIPAEGEYSGTLNFIISLE